MNDKQVPGDILWLKQAEKEIRKIPTSRPAIRLKAIIAAAHHPVERVAEVFDVSVRTVFRWQNQFKKNGLPGLIDGQRGHPPAKLSDTHKVKIKKWLQSGKNSHGKKVHWTLKRLRAEIKTVFNIDISIAALWNHLQKTDLPIEKQPGKDRESL